MFKQWNRVNQPSSNQNHREWPRGRRWQPVNMVMEISIDSGKFSASNTNGGFPWISFRFMCVFCRYS